jgi:hypothetical protein
VRLVSLIGGATGGCGNLYTSLSNVARLAVHPKFVWVFSANYDGTIIYNDPVHFLTSGFIWGSKKIFFYFSVHSPLRLFPFFECPRCQLLVLRIASSFTFHSSFMREVPAYSNNFFFVLTKDGHMRETQYSRKQPEQISLVVLCNGYCFKRYSEILPRRIFD